MVAEFCAILLLAGAAAAIAVSAAATKSTVSVAFGWSAPRLLVIVVASLAASTLLLAGLWWQPVRRLAVVTGLNLLFIIAGCEAILRLLADRLPVQMVQLLPVEAAADVMARRGLFTAATIRGDGLLYSYQPHLTLRGQPWVTIDVDGYRNPPNAAPSDVILLGDSVTLARTAEQDLGAHLRAAGHRTINLGFDGYGPGHYAEAYRRLVLDRQQPHRLVVVTFCHCNDLDDAVAFDRLLAGGGSWREYLRGGASAVVEPPLIRLSWVLSALLKAPSALLQWRNVDRLPPVTVNVAGRTVTVPGAALAPDGRTPDGLAWQTAETHLRALADAAHAHGATVVFGYYPNLADIYAPWMGQEEREGAAQQAANFRALAERVGATFVDYTAVIREAAAAGGFSAVESDYHPDDRGTKAVAAALLPVVRDALAQHLAR
ncbi:MAG: hypothetical protein HY985_10930 [Magnetospirillum sp.]|nr:hypothetical protein [Magnetospirillum sp.]